uniref:Succinate dehydrogenase subunit 3 n=1 Tax=Picea glauca TaxID=3330 RepID=A0A117NHI1_PICGL|nr:succinate dehydrogenase subunit 3 [Picea glauca]QHR90603.1 putative succinate dehydrogenase subunit 3 [Picea sitchensis]
MRNLVNPNTNINRPLSPHPTHKPQFTPTLPIYHKSEYHRHLAILFLCSPFLFASLLLLFPGFPPLSATDINCLLIELNFINSLSPKEVLDH